MNTDENTPRPLAAEDGPAPLEPGSADEPTGLAPVDPEAELELEAEADPEPVKPTVIVMHASVGSGHRSAAYAVAQAFELMRDARTEDADATADGSDAQPPVPADLDVEVIDVLDYGRIVFDGNNAASLFTGATRPIYDLIALTSTGRLLWGGGSAWSHLMYSKFTDYVRERKPLAIVCTHITAANVAVAARMLTGQHYSSCETPPITRPRALPQPLADLFWCRETVDGRDAAPAQGLEESISVTGITRDDFSPHFHCVSTRV